MKKILELKNFNVKINGKEIIKELNLDVHEGEIIAIMGPNGSGKSSLAYGLMGHPLYETSGEAMIEDENILDMAADKRSKKGLFLSFQNPVEISGVSVSNFLRTALNAHSKEKIRISEFRKLLDKNMEMLHINKDFASRYLNEGFSGGEKKKMEILQLAVLNPKIAILDETDSGLDIDALREVCEGINIIKKENTGMAVIIITHYQRILNYIAPDRICILLDGKIVKQGDASLAHELEKKGYEEFR